MSVIDPIAARELLRLNPDALFVDVRTASEFESAHIPGAINLPLTQIDAHLQRVVSDAGGRLVLVCQGGSRAQRCQTILGSAGLSDTVVLEGGMNAWLADNGPVVRGRGRWALERQVRLTAGGLVALAVAISVWWPPARFLAGGIGAGLVFAAVTDTCAMGMMLSKLPYNRPAKPLNIDANLARLRGQPA